MIIGTKGSPKIDFSEFTNEPTGFVTPSTSTMTMTGRTFTIQPSGTSYTFLDQGRVWVKTSAESLTITADSGLHFIYFNNGSLTETINPTDAQLISLISTTPLVSVIYWDAVNSEAIYVGEERHGLTMDGITHLYEHFANGLLYLFGLGLSGFNADASGDSNTAAQFAVESGGIADEDIFLQPTAIATTTGLKMFYRTGATGTWVATSTAGYSILTTGTGRMAYNQSSVGSWGLDEVANTKFALCHVFASTEKDTPIISIIGQAEYQTINEARQGANDEVNNLLLGNLPTPELTAIGTVIFQTADAYTNAVKSRVRTTDLGDNYVDFREASVTRSGAVDSHSELSNLDNDDHLQYTLVDGTRTQTALEISGTLTVASMATVDSLSVTNSVTVGGLTKLNDDTTIAAGKKFLFAST